MLSPRPILTAAVLIAAFAAPAQEDEGRQYFSLSSNRVVAPGETAKVQLSTSGAVRELEFRLYRVKDQVAFWRGLDEEQHFGGTPRPPSRPRTWLEKYVDWRARTRARLRDTVRAQYSPEHRAAIREFLDKPAEQKPRPVTKGRTYADVPVLNSEQLVSSWRQAIVKKEEWDQLTVDVPLTEAGMYVLEATTGSRHAYTVLSASRLALITKAWKGRIQVRAVDAASGEPQPSVPVTIIDARERKELAVLKTDSSGLIDYPVEDAADEGLRLIACRDRDCALAHVSGWPLGLAEQRSLTGVVYTDRPVYRPGHTVHYRAIAMADPRDVRVEVQNPSGEPVKRESGSFSQFGTASGELTLDTKAPTGYYSVQFTSGQASLYGGFHVEEYRKPEYEVKVVPSVRRIVQGGKIRASIEARYYYGEPVKGASVKYAVRKARAWLWFDPEWESESMGDEEAETYGTEQVDEKEGRLDDEGRLEIEVPTSLDDHDQRYVVDARITDSSGREISGLGGFLATRGDYMLLVRPNSYVHNPGDAVTLQLRAYDFDGKPVGDLDVAVKVTERLWGENLNRTPWSSSYSARIGSDGTGGLQFKAPDSGSYSVQASVRGTRVTGEGYLWITGGLTWSSAGGNQIQIVPDKGSYSAGETARVMVAAGAPGSHLWITVESRNLLWSKFVVTKSAAEVIEIPVTSEWEPNVFVEVSLIRDRQFMRGSKIVKVPALRRRIDVRLQTDKPQYLPGETAQIELTALDHQKKPVRGEFSVGVVDEPIYAIQPDRTPDLAQAFYGRQWNRVSTEESLSFYFYGESGRRRMMLAGSRPPGVRGQLKPPAPVQPKVRKLFPDTAFWIADLKTGDNGRARVSFTWPDALTTWRTTARGIDLDDRVGNASLRTIVRKNILLTMAAPRFLTQGDEIQIPYLIRNYYDTAQRMQVSFEAKGAQVLAGPPPQAEVPSKGESRLDARLRAGSTGSAGLLGKVLGTVESDALDLPVPILPGGLQLSGAAPLQGAGSTTVVFPSGDTAATRTLSVQITPSVAGAIFGALDYLIEYPYGCVEQTMSSLLPNLVVAEAVKQLKLPPPVPEDELRKKVQAGVERLAAFQHPDGGWGWWRGDDTSPFLTAYVVMGMHMAAQQGMNPRPDVLARGVSALQKQFDAERMHDETRAWQLYALSLSNGTTKPRLDKIWTVRETLSPFGLAVLGLALHATNDARSTEVKDLLVSQVKRDSGGAYWSSDHDPMFYYASDYSQEATAFAARFLARVSPGDPLLAQAARWLVRNRNRGYYWDSTKRTALVVLGLTGYLAQSGELKPDYSAKVFVNGKEVLDRRFSEADALAARPVTVDVPSADLRDSNDVKVEMNGKGEIYTAVNWTSRVPGESLQLPAGNGLTIERSYYRLMPAKEGARVLWNPEPLSGPARPGDLLGVRLTIRADRERQYLLIEDPIPSGSELVRNEERYDIKGGDRLFRSWWTRREERDDRVTFFPTWLRKGESTFTYLLKVTHAGRFAAPPARVEPMYEPGVLSSSAPFTLEVNPQ